jgi:hypothetical protein
MNGGSKSANIDMSVLFLGMLDVVADQVICSDWIHDKYEDDPQSMCDSLFSSLILGD